MVPPSPQKRSSPVDGLLSGEVPLQALDLCEATGGVRKGGGGLRRMKKNKKKAKNKNKQKGIPKKKDKGEKKTIKLP